MRKIYAIVLLLITFVFASASIVSAAIKVDPANPAPTLDPKEIVIDSECMRLRLTAGGYNDKNLPVCNDTCERGIIFESSNLTSRKSNVYCLFGFTNKTLNISTNTDMTLPLEQPVSDAALMYLRSSIYAILGVASIIMVAYGLYGWYLRTMSEGESDKVKEAIEIYKNVIVGGIIVFMASIITQIVFLVLGVTDSVFEFNFIPKSGYSVNVKESDIGRACYSNQTDKNGVYTCVNNVWK